MKNQAIKEAIKEAEKSTCRYRLGAVALREGAIVARGYNQYDTHPYLQRRYGFYSIHAEAITTLRSQYYKADTIVIVRILKDNSLTCSFPCKKCQQVLRDSSIKKVIYIDWNGKQQEMKL